MSSITAGGDCHVVPTGMEAGDIAQADFASFAEVGAGRAGSRVEGDEAGVEGGFKQSAMAGLRGWSRRIKPCGDAAVDKSVSVVAVQIDFRVVRPTLLAGFRIERDDTIEGCGQIQSSISYDRRALKAAPFPVTSAIRHVTGVEDPGYLELRDIIAVDLRERRVTHATGIVAVRWPVVGRVAGCSADTSKTQNQGANKQQAKKFIHLPTRYVPTTSPSGDRWECSAAGMLVQRNLHAAG